MRWRYERDDRSFHQTFILEYDTPQGLKYQAYSDSHTESCRAGVATEIKSELLARAMDDLRSQLPQREVIEPMPNYMGNYIQDIQGWQVTTNASTNTNNSYMGGTNCTPDGYINFGAGATTNPYVVYQTPTQNWDPMPVSWTEKHEQIKRVNVRFKLGKHTLCMYKDLDENGSIEITDEDITRAKDTYFKEKRVQIITRKAEGKAEDLLKMFISEVDFRSYKANGFFTVKQGNQVFRIWKDSHKHIDSFEKDADRGIFVPKNRLCVHTERRVCPPADEALTKLLLIRSGKVEESANIHSADGLEKELVLV